MGGGWLPHHWTTADESDGMGAAPINLKFSILTPIYTIKCHCSLNWRKYASTWVRAWWPTTGQQQLNARRLGLRNTNLSEILYADSYLSIPLILEQSNYYYVIQRHSLSLSLFPCSWNSQTTIILYKDIIFLSLFSPVLGTVKPLFCYSKTFSLSLFRILNALGQVYRPLCLWAIPKWATLWLKAQLHWTYLL